MTSRPRQSAPAPNLAAALRASLISERDLQQWVADLCGLLHLLHYHTCDSRGSGEGFPDSVIVGTRVLYRELKSERGTVDPAQQVWMDALAEAGEDVAVWRPSDWLPSVEHPNGRVRDELEALAFRMAE